MKENIMFLSKTLSFIFENFENKSKERISWAQISPLILFFSLRLLSDTFFFSQWRGLRLMLNASLLC